MKKQFFLLWLCLLALIINSCRKTEMGNPGQVQKNKYGAGALLDQKAYLNTKRANFDEIRSNLINMGYRNKLSINSTQTLPSSLILNHPPVGDQGNTGTCVSWSVGYALRGTLNNVFYNGAYTPNPTSGWYIYQVDHSGKSDCSVFDGMYTQDGMNILKTNGVPAASLDASLGIPCTAPTATVNANAIFDNVASYSAISIATAVTDIKNALNMGLPVEIAFREYQSLQDAFTNHTVYTTVGSNYLGTGHAVCIIGYDDSKHAFLIQNSWGTGGGDLQYPGCMWFDYGLFATGGLPYLEMYVATPPAPYGVYYKNSKTIPFGVTLTNTANSNQTYSSALIPNGSGTAEFTPSPALPSGFYNVTITPGGQYSGSTTYTAGIIGGTTSTYPIKVNNVYIAISSGNYTTAQITIK